MSNKFTRTIYLVQHTPIIHFQYDQEGTTLRATELKPKLDRFIFEQLDEIPKNWLVGHGKSKHQALDYKVKITLSGKASYNVIHKGDNFPPMFFGNMGDDYYDNPKALVTTDKPVRIEFFSLQTDLLEWVEDFFPAFISITNFGTRQNKGFGSFSIWDEEKEEIVDLSSILSNTPYLQISTTDLEAILTVINYYYQRLKSGVNYRNHYERAFLRQYLGDQDYTWEKRFLKEKFVGGLEPNKKEERFARALLGLPGSFTFKREPKEPTRPPYPKFDIDIEVSDKRANSSEKITRIKSPITFKPIVYEDKRQSRIYIVTHDYDARTIKTLENKAFIFSKGNKTEELPTPKENEFFKISDLVEKYHEHLKNSFRAQDFTGRNQYSVQIKK